jgi:SAM-dependent methyltransferase
MFYDSLNHSVLAVVPKTSTWVLDVGCGSGAMGRQLKENLNCQVFGITHSEIEAKLAAQWLDKTFVDDLNCFNTKLSNVFDCIICSHVLEHIYSPEILLLKLRNHLKTDGVLIVALPNVLHWKQRLEFLKGNFKYTDGGLMDRTHFRFFDWDTALDLVQSSGFKVISREADGYFPLPGIRKLIKPFALTIDRAATRVMPGLLGTQFIIVAQAA